MKRRSWRRLPPLLVVVSLVLGLMSSLWVPRSAVAHEAVVQRSYTESVTSFPNPERGWHVTIDPDYSTNTTAPPLTVSQLRSYRAEGITLVRKYYLLYPYKDSPIAQSYLEQQLVADLQSARTAGIKLIPRFTYTWNLRFAPDAHEDASAERILTHLDQLQPIFAAHYAVINHVEMGFVGYWGEWHDSSNDNLNNGDLTLNSTSQTIIHRVLTAVPASRMVLLRYPKQLMQLFPTPLAESQAFDGSDQARIGVHDDGVLYDASNFGTYDGDLTVREQQQSYLAQATQFVIMSGEPGGVNETQYAVKSDPISELERMHWTSISSGQGDADDLYGVWRSSGVHEEIGRRLGYRFSLQRATASKLAQRGGVFHVSFTMKNSGFASARNERPVELVLRRVGTRDEYVARVPADPRRWWSGSSTEVAAAIGVPRTMPPGRYQLFLNFPDPEPTLAARPDYAIRLANDGVWEDYSGYNRLGLPITIAQSRTAAGSATDAVLSRRANPPTPPAAEPTITLLPEPITPRSAPTPVLTDGDTIVSFDDRPGTATPLDGPYTGATWRGGWNTVGTPEGTYLYATGGVSKELIIHLPPGKVLKSFSLRKMRRDGTHNRITVMSSGNPDYNWGNPAPWWSQHSLGWREPSEVVRVSIESDSSDGVANLVLDNLVFGSPPPADVRVDFEGLTPGQLLTGVYGGIDWGSDGLWRVGETEDGNTFIALDSAAGSQEATILVPEGMVLKGIGMQKRTGEDANGDRIAFIDESGNYQSWSWIPVGWWLNGYSFPWTAPSGSVTVQVVADGGTIYGVNNVMIGELRYGTP